jgi:hypothetical protein
MTDSHICVCGLIPGPWTDGVSVLRVSVEDALNRATVSTVYCMSVSASAQWTGAGNHGSTCARVEACNHHVACTRDDGRACTLALIDGLAH